MKYRYVLIFLLTIFSHLAFANTLSKILPNYSCSEKDMMSEPKTSVFADSQWENVLNEAVNKNIFNPLTAETLRKSSHYVSPDVSMSHLVTNLMSVYKKIQIETNKRIQSKKLQLVEDQVTYSEEEYKNRIESTAQFKKEYIDPQLADLYRVYLEALDSKASKKVNAANDAKSMQEFFVFVQNQRNTLNTLIQKIRPSILEKIGDLIPVEKNNSHLPFSYRDGYIVKMRFKRKDSDQHLAVYPRMLMTQILGEDDFFVNTLKLWKDYCYENWQDALKLKESFIFSPSYLVYLLKKLFGSTVDASALIEKEPQMKLVYESAKKDYEGAAWVHEEVKKLTQQELASLLDIFKQLRFGDYPKCLHTISFLNKTMQFHLKGEQSSSSIIFNPIEKSRLEQLAKDIVFYQDIFQSFSESAAHLMR